VKAVATGSPRAVEAASDRSQEHSVAWAAVLVLGTGCALIAPALLLFLLGKGASFLLADERATLLSTRWFPAEGSFGLVPLVLGSLTVALGGLVIALPLGVGTAVTLHYYLRGRTQQLAEAALGVLGGIPSVVFGLFGTFWLVPRIGASLLAGMCVLAAMLTPTLALLTLAALRQLPTGLIPDGLRLGISRETVILRLALRAAGPGIFGAAVLALSRGLGEALAVEMVCGNVPGLPTSLTSPIRTLTTTLVQEFEYAQPIHNQGLHLVALTIVLIAALTSAAALRLRERKSA
jgi:phosphate transport system permease protein